MLNETETEQSLISSPVIAVIDDTSLFLAHWRFKLKDICVETFLSPEEFWSTVEAQPGFLGSLTCVITDLNFETPDPVAGLFLAKALKQRRPDLPVFLSTCAPSVSHEHIQWVDEILGKQADTWEILAQRIATARRRLPRI